VVLHGLPAVGKLTTARELVKLSGYRLFHNHLCVDMVASVFDFGTSAFNECRLSVWMMMFDKIFAEKPAKGVVFTFCFEQTADDFFEALMKLAAKRGVRPIFIELTCLSDSLSTRVVERKDAGTSKLADQKLLVELLHKGAIYSGAAQGKCENDLEFDNSRSSPHETAKILAEFLAKFDVATAGSVSASSRQKGGHRDDSEVETETVHV